MTTDALTPDSPADAALRRLAALCAERTLAGPTDPVRVCLACQKPCELSGVVVDVNPPVVQSACCNKATEERAPPDLRPVWKFCGYLTKQLAVLARKLPPDVQGQFTAKHVATLWCLAVRPTPADGQQRRGWRTAYALLLGAMGEMGIAPELTLTNVTVSCALWSGLQQMAYHAAMEPMPASQPPAILTLDHNPQRAQEEAMARRHRLLELREMLVADWGEAVMDAAGFCLQQQAQLAAQGEQGKPQPAQTPTLQEWEHHVLRTPGEGRGGVAYCSAQIWSHDWHFLDASHAARAVASGDRLQPCPACWAAIPEADREAPAS